MTSELQPIAPAPAMRAFVAWCCTLLVVGVLLWNIPIPALQERYRERAQPLYDLTRLDQDWGFFAPDVSQPSWLFHLEVTRADGTVERVDFPDGDPWIGTFRAYRWSAYEENLLDDAILRADAMNYAAETVAARDDPSGSALVRVDLILREAEPPETDTGPFDPVFEREVYDSLELAASEGEAS